MPFVIFGILIIVIAFIIIGISSALFLTVGYIITLKLKLTLFEASIICIGSTFSIVLTYGVFFNSAPPSLVPRDYYDDDDDYYEEEEEEEEEDTYT